MLSCSTTELVEVQKFRLGVRSNLFSGGVKQWLTLLREVVSQSTISGGVQDKAVGCGLSAFGDGLMLELYDPGGLFQS